jgi:hypothetical protein
VYLNHRKNRVWRLDSLRKTTCNHRFWKETLDLPPTWTPGTTTTTKTLEHGFRTEEDEGGQRHHRRRPLVLPNRALPSPVLGITGPPDLRHTCPLRRRHCREGERRPSIIVRVRLEEGRVRCLGMARGRRRLAGCFPLLRSLSHCEISKHTSVCVSSGSNEPKRGKEARNNWK